jgi:DNA-binding NtrC family response regulator
VRSDPRSILVIDYNSDCGVLLVRTLMRKFPSCVVQICGDAPAAIRAMETQRFDALVVHRTEDIACVDLLPILRKIDPIVPIIAVSGIDRTTEAIAAGASMFLSYEEWLRVGMVVQELLEKQTTERRKAFNVALASSPESDPPSPLAQRMRGPTPNVPDSEKPL